MKSKNSIFIDFDGTISPRHGFDSPPAPATIETIKKLFEEYQIIIYSCRANIRVCDPADVKKMTDYLDKHGVPYDGVEYGKPLFTWLIDDRSLNPNLVSWEKIYQIINPDKTKIFLFDEE